MNGTGSVDLANVIQVISIAETLLGSGVIPGLKKFFSTHYELTPTDLTDLNNGLDDLLKVKTQIAARRKELHDEDAR